MIGTVVHGYAVTRQLAAGGMGTVWLATHSTMERNAVVKVLHAEVARDPVLIERFFNEARAAASIQDPGIVQVFDVGRLPDGQPYLVMEHLVGETLGDRARARRDTALDRARVIETLQLLRLVVRTLAAAHAKGIVHRDLKPENIFVVRDPDVEGGERIKILDFGIAKLAGATPSQLTRAGTFFGTPAYMAPEQCTDAGTVDARADLYAVGCIAYEMLAGAPPFGFGGVELVAAHMRDEPPALATKAPGVPHALAAVVERLLRKDPDERFATARALLDELEKVSATSISSRSEAPTIAAQPAPPRSLPPPARRTWLFAGLGVLVLGVAIAVVVVTRREPAAADPPAPAPTASLPVDAAPDAPQVAVAETPVADAAAPVVEAAAPADAAIEIAVDAAPTQETAPAPGVPSSPKRRPPPRPTPPKPLAPTTPVTPPAPTPAPEVTPAPTPPGPTPTPTPAPTPTPTPAPTPAARRVVRVEAGPIWNSKDAQAKCRKACQAPLVWTGNWRTTVAGKQSTCDCESRGE